MKPCTAIATSPDSLAERQDKQGANNDGMRGPNSPFKYEALHCRAQVVTLPLPTGGLLRAAILSAPGG